MRGRTILFLLAVLVVLAAVATLFETSRRRATRVSGTPLFKDLKTDLVDRIRIRWQGKESLLEKKDGKWVVASEGGFPAEPKSVTDIIDKLPKFHADEVISDNPSNRALFQVDTTGAEVWVNQQGKEIGHFFVGKPGPDFLSTYVRPASSDRVLLVQEYLPHLFEKSDTWRERTLFKINQEDIRRYEYTSPSRGTLAVAKDDAGVWHMEAPDTGRVEAGKLSSALRAFANAKASGFADTVTAAAAGLDSDTTRISATLADGSACVLQVGRQTTGNQMLVRKQGADNVVTFPRGGINTMMPRKEVLLPAPAP